MHEHDRLRNDLIRLFIVPLSLGGRISVAPPKTLVNMSAAAVAQMSWSDKSLPSLSLLGMNKTNRLLFGSVSEARISA